MIEADLQRIYGVQLADLWRGELTLRRVRVLIEHLPYDSPSAHALSGATNRELAAWSLAEVLLGRLIDEVAVGRWQWERAHGAKTEQPKSVLPSFAPKPKAELVSPHQLGSFVNQDLEVA